jgi:outer membrane autotransporter protein
MLKSFIPTARAAQRPIWKSVLLCSIALLPMLGSAARAEDGTLRLMSLNIWNKFKQTPAITSDFMIGGNWDVLMFQEANSSRYVSDIPGILQNAGLGTYGGHLIGDVGIISRLPGTYGSYTTPGLNTQGRYVSYTIANADGGRPTTLIGTVHLDYADQDTNRLREAKGLVNWAKAATNPIILSGDFNAGDVSERGLHSKSQQELLLRIYTKNPNNSFYYNLLTQYAQDRTALDKFIADWRGRGNAAIDAAPIPTSLFADETYAVAGNTPRTMNVFKRQFMLMQTEAEREGFAPHELNDGSATWPSAGEDATNTWGSWHRVKIDHFMISRPFGKWYTIVDDPNDPYLGVIKDVYVTRPDGSRTPLSDHEPVAHEFRWIGPRLETYTETIGGANVSRTRLVWDEDATTFAEEAGAFYLTRNNMRTDVYLGQVADENGNPILTGLTDAEKRTLLDCTSTDPRFQQAILDYCIDDHSFIGETLVTDGGTVIVEEDAALGLSTARLRLDDGGLRIVGANMSTLDRDVSLEGAGGFIDVAGIDSNVVASGVFSGDGGFEKRGEGQLILTGTSTYTGATAITNGLLSVNGSIASSQLTTIADGGTLGGTGTVGNLRVANGGTLAPGNSIGTLKVDGDLTFEQGATFRVEADSEGNTDKVEVSGSATLAGTVVSVAAGGRWKADNGYDLLSAAGGINGSFDRIVTDLSFLTPTLSLEGGRLVMSLDRNDTAFDGVATTANRRSVAAAIDMLGAGNPIYDEIVLTDAETADAAFRDLSGDVHASALGGFVENAMELNSIIGNRMSGVVDGSVNTAAAGEGELWLKAYGSWGLSEADGVSGAERATAGTLLGYDVDIGHGWQAGVFGGFGQSSIALDDIDAKIDATSYHVGAYASTEAGPLAFSLGGAYTANNADSQRRVTYGDLGETLTADYTVDVLQVFGEASYRFDTGIGTLAPFLGLAHVRASTNGFVEQGGSAALQSSGDVVATTFATLGLRVEQELALEGISATLRGEIGWRHAFGDVDPQVDLAFDGGDAFRVVGAPVSVDSAVLSAAVDFKLAPQSTFSVGYGGQLGMDASNHAVSAALKIGF